ncbi:hypothetical protein IW261DRAFT_1425066 [Armillaria novae-zelandiae]|uniref:Uncharacterized protein n=1 Tax=Armillaria novae-zelandiae TaxID=153914 RepID=A0AA39NUD0_9AGAR|nr:hypothetical protein IW261DRAFT_1425066 [Armillaria novae-zelandiae]
MYETYKLISVFDVDNVRMIRDRALETPLDHRRAMLLVYQGEVLWLRVSVNEEQRCNDKEASKERNVRSHQMRQDPCHEPEDWDDVLHRKRDDEAQHHRASHDRQTNNIYGNMPLAGPSRLTTTMPNRPNPPLQPYHQLQKCPGTSPTRRPSCLPSRTKLHAEVFAETVAYRQKGKIKRATHYNREQDNLQRSGRVFIGNVEVVLGVTVVILYGVNKTGTALLSLTKKKIGRHIPAGKVYIQT